MCLAAACDVRAVWHIPGLLFPEHRRALRPQEGGGADEEEHDDEEGTEVEDGRLCARKRVCEHMHEDVCQLTG